MSKQTELRYQPKHELRVSPESNGTRTLRGYAVVFNSKSVDLGGFKETVNQRALDNTLKNNPDVRCLNNHDPKAVLGRTTSGTLKLDLDPVGLRFAVSLDTRSSQANDLAIAVERGDISGCSFGFRCLKDSWQNEANELTRTLHDIELGEISITGSPAYEATQVSIRSVPQEFRSLLTRSSVDDDEDDCECDCDACEAGDCDDCTNPDFDHDEERSRLVSVSEVRRMHMRLELMRRR
jgi:HK97 family phage prohead protease